MTQRLIAAAAAIRTQADIRFAAAGAKPIDTALLCELIEAVEDVQPAAGRGSAMVDLEALKRELNEKSWYIDGGMANRELCVNLETALAIIARHVQPAEPSPDRAALVERMAVIAWDALARSAVPFEQATPEQRATYRKMADRALAALTKSGRLVPEGYVVIDRARWQRVRGLADTARVVNTSAKSEQSVTFALFTSALDVQCMALEPGDLDAAP